MQTPNLSHPSYLTPHGFSIPSTPYGIGSHYFCCNVIMNHRGPDVEKGFPRHLYRRLIVHELGVLLDAEELQRVDNLTSQIEGAIRTASVHIVVLSSGYAESSWCLNKLVFMSESGSTVLLLFYNVNPSELRWMEGGDGVYVRTLLILEKYSTFDFYPRYDSHAIEEWRDFLSVVVEIRRFELNACNGGEGQLVCKFGQPELENVSKTPLNVAKYPTGVDEKVKNVRGIVGLGGVGKIVLAKEFFNRSISNYGHFCFVYDGRENALKSSLNSLQSTVIKELV